MTVKTESAPSQKTDIKVVLATTKRITNQKVTIKTMKKHELPEFQVIRQKEANAKFFVASGLQQATQEGAKATTIGNAGGIECSFL